MNYFNVKRMTSMFSIISSISFVATNSCTVKANLDIDLGQMISDLDQCNTEQFDKILADFEAYFLNKYEDIIELDESWEKADKRIKYLYYKVIDKSLLEIPILKVAIKDLNGVMKHKLKFKTRNDTCVVSYTPSEHSFGASLSKNGFDCWNAINNLSDFKSIYLSPNKYISKFNRGEFFFPLKNPKKIYISDKTSPLDKYVSSRMLSMSNLSYKKREMANLVNSIIHELGHLLHEFIIRGDNLDGIYRKSWIDYVGLKNSVYYKWANWEWADLRNQIYVNINGSKLTNFINFLIFLHVAKENNLNIRKDENTFEISDISQDAYDYGDILFEKLSMNDKVEYGHLSGRAMDSSCEFMAELWVAAVGCGVRENSWGKEFRKYLKMQFGPNCLGNAGNNWYTDNNRPHTP